MRQFRGFTLIETIIVVALIAGAMTVALTIWTQRAREQTADSFVAQAATEMAMLARATTSYFTTERVATLTDNVTAELPIGTLVTAGLLPANFAMRGGVIGTSVFGQQYQIRYRRLPGGSGRAPTAAFVVAELGVPQVANITRTATPNTEQGILTLKTRIAGRVAEVHNFPSGTVPRDSRVAQGGFRGFTLDLSAYLTTRPTQAIAVVLGNFAELGGSIIPPGTPENPIENAICSVLDPFDPSRRLPAGSPMFPYPCGTIEINGQPVQAYCDANIATQYMDPPLPDRVTLVRPIGLCGVGGETGPNSSFVLPGGVVVGVQLQRSPPVVTNVPDQLCPSGVRFQGGVTSRVTTSNIVVANGIPIASVVCGTTGTAFVPERCAIEEMLDVAERDRRRYLQSVDVNPQPSVRNIWIQGPDGMFDQGIRTYPRLMPAPGNRNSMAGYELVCRR
ncbi:type II secretion system protein [Aquimonas sp.]|jgi:prepilin-type N-terminal cleavage/methylation domain-containing protein|uniref:type II secretion system protein n=1 Tax=Aquimonas sp. TaxID=1872588 RepID=UPI0037C16316